MKLFRKLFGGKSRDPDVKAESPLHLLGTGTWEDTQFRIEYFCDPQSWEPY
jgi:hypothetical protein